jgi:hypothetical protein
MNVEKLTEELKKFHPKAIVYVNADNHEKACSCSISAYWEDLLGDYCVDDDESFLEGLDEKVDEYGVYKEIKSDVDTEDIYGFPLDPMPEPKIVKVYLVVEVFGS